MHVETAPPAKALRLEVPALASLAAVTIPSRADDALIAIERDAMRLARSPINISLQSVSAIVGVAGMGVGFLSALETLGRMSGGRGSVLLAAGITAAGIGAVVASCGVHIMARMLNERRLGRRQAANLRIVESEAAAATDTRRADLAKRAGDILRTMSNLEAFDIAPSYHSWQVMRPARTPTERLSAVAELDRPARTLLSRAAR